MSNTLKHGFTSAKADDVDTSLIQPSHWNSEHVFSGGALGSLLYRDTGATDGANWLADVAAGAYLRSGGVGVAPVWSTLTLPNAATQGDLLIASSANVIGSLADVAAGSVLVSGGIGSAPAFSATPSLTDLTLTGVLKLANGLVGTPALGFTTDPDTGLYLSATGDMRFTTNGVDRFRLTDTAAAFASTYNLSWGSSGVTAPDLLLTRDAAATLAQRNGTNAQTFRIYNTFTDASNYERTDLVWSSNAFTIKTTQAGTGTGRSLTLDGSSSLNLSSAGTVRWQVTSSGHLIAPLADNTYDIGASAATRPRTIFVGTDVALNGTGALRWEGSTRIRNSSDGVLLLLNNASNDFTRVQFGGTSASFPALKRSGTGIAVRLADDSADAGLTAASITTSATTLHTTSAALTNGAGVATGTLTNAPAAGNPTKWIPINDNGTTRYIPAW